jgi:UDP-3-O-[3-hydroxymyristoyl] glucosamine N-acyltransferase
MAFRKEDPREIAEAYERCGVIEDFRSNNDFYLVREGQDAQLYAVPREISIHDELATDTYELTEEGALISHNAKVYPAVELRGRVRIENLARVTGSTVLGKSCHIAEDAHVQSSSIGEFTTLDNGARIDESEIGRFNNVGVLSHLHTVRTGETVIIGDITTIEKTDIGGFSSIGSYVNIGHQNSRKRTSIGLNSDVVDLTKIIGGRKIPNDSVVYPRQKKAYKGNK